MQHHNLDAYILPSSDPHQSEYVAEYWNSRAWLSGFTGSAGIVVVTKKWAGLWTDSRYFIQAEEQLEDSGIDLMKVNEDISYEDWLIENLDPNSRIGIDGRLLSVSQEENLSDNLESYCLELVKQDLITAIWKDRPELSKTKVFIHEMTYAGQSSQEKIAAVRAEMEEE
ncbi:MAG: aminopeptidase P family N-terminal domain-containing protein, partial [Bacteroidota bacterium]